MLRGHNERSMSKPKDRIHIGREERVFVLTGAGVSAESGLKTFRDQGGLWEGHRVEDVATPERGPKMRSAFGAFTASGAEMPAMRNRIQRTARSLSLSRCWAINSFS